MSEFDVQTTEGKLRGTTDGNVHVWRGVPFAAPPIADLRFRAPQPPPAYRGTRQATEFGPQAAQKTSIFNPASPTVEGSAEDCLYLNVWSPGADSSRRPVMVWIHGGAYVAGSGRDEFYNGASLADNGDVVVVTVNYRLGPFGFLHFSELALENGHPEGFDDNLGVLDQLAALNWIHRNIAAFGGDPGNVTIFGESAGGASVTTLLGVPKARGLFHRAIAQSPCVNAGNTPARSKRNARRFMELLGIDPADMGELKAVHTERALQAMHDLVEECIEAEPGSIVAAPLVGDALVPFPPTVAAARQIGPQVPLMIGTNSDEASIFSFGKTPLLPTRPGLVEKMFGRIGEEAMERIVHTYPDYPRRKALLNLAADWMFKMPVTWLAEKYGRNNPTWVYQFNYASPFLKMSGFGAAHSSEIPYVFHSWDSTQAKVITGLSQRQTVEEFGARLQAVWLRFARTGDPNPCAPEEEQEDALLLMESRPQEIVEKLQEKLGSERDGDVSGGRLETLERTLEDARASLGSLRKLILGGAREEQDDNWIPWPAYTAESRQVRHINWEDTVVEDPDSEIRQAWETVRDTEAGLGFV